jgi:hypothetical protein
MAPVAFEAAMPASKRPQTYALDRAATGMGCFIKCREIFSPLPLPLLLLLLLLLLGY